jgi:peptidoglycan/LPS O-acetylase OafA/YrhL
VKLKWFFLNRALARDQTSGPARTLAPTPTPDHWALLAASRFVLAMIVYMGHLGGTLGNNHYTHEWWNYGELAAVLGFFVISGFSIGHSIDQRPKRYLLRRLWRIWPTYLFSFLCCTLPAVFILPHHTSAYPADQHVTKWIIFGNLFMLQGLFMPVLEANAATWTLAIEEWCYLAGPIFRRCGSWLLAAIIIVSAYCYVHATSWGWIRFASETRGVSHLSFVWAWLLGFLFYRHRNSIWAHVALVLVPVWLICCANELGGLRSPFTLAASTLVIAFGGKLMLSLSSSLPQHLAEIEWRRGRIFVLRWEHVRELLIFLGNVSYPLYIVHYPVFFLLCRLTNWHSKLGYGIVVMLLCVVVYFVIDKPNRPRWKPRERKQTPETKEKPMAQASTAPAKL